MHAWVDKDVNNAERIATDISTAKKGCKSAGFLAPLMLRE